VLNSNDRPAIRFARAAGYTGGVQGYDVDKLILIVTGSTVRAEDKDRPLANRLARAIRRRLPPGSAWKVVVISDLYYLNNDDLHDCPMISVGGPGVNHCSQVLYRELPAVLAVEHVLLIQMDVGLEDLRICLWGMDHDTTVEALQTFVRKGYLDRYLAGVLAASNA
jgi:hypothetical protein